MASESRRGVKRKTRAATAKAKAVQEAQARWEESFLPKKQVKRDPEGDESVPEESAEGSPPWQGRKTRSWAARTATALRNQAKAARSSRGKAKKKVTFAINPEDVSLGVSDDDLEDAVADQSAVVPLDDVNPTPSLVPVSEQVPVGSGSLVPTVQVLTRRSGSGRNSTTDETSNGVVGMEDGTQVPIQEVKLRAPKKVAPGIDIQTVDVTVPVGQAPPPETLADKIVQALENAGQIPRSSTSTSVGVGPAVPSIYPPLPSTVPSSDGARIFRSIGTQTDPVSGPWDYPSAVPYARRRPRSYAPRAYTPTYSIPRRPRYVTRRRSSRKTRRTTRSRRRAVTTVSRPPTYRQVGNRRVAVYAGNQMRIPEVRYHPSITPTPRRVNGHALIPQVWYHPSITPATP